MAAPSTICNHPVHIHNSITINNYSSPQFHGTHKFQLTNLLSALTQLLPITGEIDLSPQPFLLSSLCPHRYTMSASSTPISQTGPHLSAHVPLLFFLSSSLKRGSLYDYPKEKGVYYFFGFA
ncbi:hypothetical protein M0R45_018871 [Rubus argutus]|uniref:Uncharacterized protein n=1 Tax=Rubus argutus TaxID=59490 RepID=A0AAW1X5N1_RUBAR